MSDRVYVPPSEPLPSASVDALLRFLDGQSLIRSAYYVGLRSRPWPRAAIRTEHLLWFELGGRRPGRATRRALSAGVGIELIPMLLRTRVGWNFVTRRMLTEAGAAATLLWRTRRPWSEDLDPLDFELRWLPMQPPPGFVAAACEVLERSSGIQRACLVDEVILKDGVQLSSRPHVYFDSTDRRWPGETVDQLRVLAKREWREFGVGRERAFAPTAEHATEIFRRRDPVER